MPGCQGHSIPAGTMSLNEIAVDLTCDPEDFQPARTTQEEQEPISGLPGSFPGFFPTPPASPPMDNKSTAAYAFPSFDVPNGSPPTYQVHSGMLRMARAMGEIGKPVHLALHTALYRNPDYG
jgi:sn1-specific diacylglycerol lipase